MNEQLINTFSDAPEKSELAESLSELLERDSRRYSGFRETEADV